MILNDLFESRMSDLDIEYQDYKNMKPVAFYSRYKMTPDEWASKNWSLIKGGQTIHEENQDDRNARIIAGEIEDAMSQGNNSLAQQKMQKLKQLGYYFDKQGRLQRMGMYEADVAEGAMKDLHTELSDKYRELAPKIEKYKDSYLAGQLYDALEAIAIEHDAELELKRMMTGARNRAHMDYDTNPGGFQNWFWYLPFADDQMDESRGGNYEELGLRKSSTDRFAVLDRTLDAVIMTTNDLKAAKQEAIEWADYDDIRTEIVDQVTGKKIFAVDGNADAMQYLDEKQDACYRKVKSRYKVWPSAYASGALVQCRKKGAANWGNKTKK
jgi:hypothetical protein